MANEKTSPIDEYKTLEEMLCGINPTVYDGRNIPEFVRETKEKTRKANKIIFDNEDKLIKAERIAKQERADKLEAIKNGLLKRDYSAFLPKVEVIEKKFTTDELITQVLSRLDNIEKALKLNKKPANKKKVKISKHKTKK